MDQITTFEQNWVNPRSGEQTISELNLLFITRDFPPGAYVGGKRAAGFCRYLPEYGIRPTVLTVQDRFYEEKDESFPAPAGIRVARTAVMCNPLEWYGRLRARICPGRESLPATSSQFSEIRPATFFRRQVRGLFSMPDRYWGWYLPGVREARRLIEEERVAALLSTGPPWTAHLIARRLKKSYGIPWLADFRDPWANAHWGKDYPSWFNHIKQRLEASCVGWADLVVCNTDGLRQDFAQSYPDVADTKWVTLTNGFDDPMVGTPPAESRPSTRLFLHIGDVYGLRRTDDFFQAIAELTMAGKLDFRSLKVLFLGGIDPASYLAASQRTGELVRKGCIEFRPRVSWRQAQEILARADLLLLFQGSHRLQVPAKFYEYLQTGKPILAVAEEGALTDLLRETGSGIWADPNDPADIASKLLSALELPVRSPAEVQLRWGGKYHYRALSGRLAEWIYKLREAVSAKEPRQP